MQVQVLAVVASQASQDTQIETRINEAEEAILHCSHDHDHETEEEEAGGRKGEKEEAAAALLRRNHHPVVEVSRTQMVQTTKTPLCFDLDSN